MVLMTMTYQYVHSISADLGWNEAEEKRLDRAVLILHAMRVIELSSVYYALFFFIVNG